METKKSIKAITTYSINVKFEGKWRQSPEYPTAEEAAENLIPFIKKHNGRFLSVTVVKNTRYVSAE